MTKRNATFDYIRGLAMVMIVWGHFSVRPDWVHDLMNPVWLACFFLCSGYFLRELPLAELAAHKARTLLLPWVAYTAVGYISQIFLALLSHQLDTFRWNMVAEDLWTGASFQANIPMWFLPALYLAIMLQALLRKFVPSTASRLGIGLAASLMGHYLLIHDCPLPLQAAKTLLYLPFLQLGNLAAEYPIPQIGRPAGMVLAALAAAVVWGRYVAWPEAAEHSPMAVYWPDAALSLLVFLALWGVMPRSPHHDWLRFIGINSLFILGTHIIFMGWAWRLFWTFFHRSPTEWEAPFLVILILAVCSVSSRYFSKIRESFRLNHVQPSDIR